MTNLKNEIQQAIGDTAPHKEHVWHKLQQPKRKRTPRMPIFISVALIAITCLWIVTLQFPAEKEQANGGDLQFVNLPFDMQWASYLNETPTILHVTNEQELAQYLHHFKVNLKMDVDFTRFDVLFTRYSSGGCGLVVDKLTASEHMLYVHLDLPEDLRNKRELNCTTELAWHLNILQIAKQPIQNATFMEGSTVVPTNFNIANIEQIPYEFELLHGLFDIESIFVKHVATNNTINITSERLLNELSSIVDALTPIQGFVDVAAPHYELAIYTTDGQLQKIYLWLSPDSDTISIMSARNTHQLYTIEKEKAQQLLQAIEGDWDDVQ